MQDNRNWFQRFTNAPIETRASTPLAGIIPPARNSATSVSVEQALNIASVFRSVSIICDSVSQMPLGVYGVDGYERAGAKLETPGIVRTPDPNDTQRGFVYDTVYSLACHGNAYWEIFGSPAIGLRVLAAPSVSVVWEKDRKVYYQGNRKITNIKHLRLMRTPDSDYGFGPIQRGNGEILAAYRLRQFADNWFNGTGMPTGILTTTQTLNEQAAKQYVASWNEFVKNNGTAIIGNGMDYKPLTVDPKNAQFLQIQQAHTVTMARLFGIPPLLLATGPENSSMTYANQQDLWIQFLTTTLSSYMNEIEGAFSTILPRTQEVRFEEAALLRMNTTAQVEVDAKQIESGTRTANEIRARDGLSALAAHKPPVPAEQSNSKEEVTMNAGQES